MEIEAKLNRKFKEFFLKNAIESFKRQTFGNNSRIVLKKYIQIFTIENPKDLKTKQNFW